MLEKSQIRNNYKIKRKNISEKAREIASKKTFAHLCKHPDYIRAESVFLFLNREEEIETDLWIEEIIQKKKVFIPLIPKDSKEMVLTEIFSLQEVEEGNFKIREIRKNLVENRLREVADLTLVPGLAFDNSGYRLGYGGGYYDRYLAAHPQTKAYGIGFAVQRLPTLPHEKYDVPLLGFFSEEGFTSFPCIDGK